MSDEIVQYYDSIAASYDESRFGNSYGEFIHAQEIGLLGRWLGGSSGRILDLGCGTGRLSGFASLGVDPSERMLDRARAKFPGKSFYAGDAFGCGLEAETMEAVICFHVVMHLAHGDLDRMLAECHRVLKPGGRLIFDFPSALRRKLVAADRSGWHGANAYTLAEIRERSNGHWHIGRTRGIAALPIHRIPAAWRMRLVALDTVICRSFLKHCASYVAVELVKL